MPTLRNYALKGLGRIGLRQRLKTSYLSDLYWVRTDPQRVERRSKEVSFYRSVLNGFRPGDLIFDVGANVGDKTDIFLRLGARVLAVEPDKAAQQVLRQRFLGFRFRQKPVVIVGKAVSDKHAVETMWIDGPGSALNTLSQKWVKTIVNDKARFSNSIDNLEFAQRERIETISLEELIETHGSPFFIKVDVEGHEPSVLRGIRRPVPYVSFEVNLPEFRVEGLECTDLLARLAADGKFNYAVNCQRGLALDQWLGYRAFSRVLEHCPENTIEVFWTSVPVIQN
jgi:FkbM family methyltransferase